MNLPGISYDIFDLGTDYRSVQFWCWFMLLFMVPVACLLTGVSVYILWREVPNLIWTIVGCFF